MAPKLLAETAGMIGVKELKDAFKEFDMDGDGEITTEELRSAMTKLMGEHMSRREIDAIVKEADDNGDGTVDFEGVTRLVRQNDVPQMSGEEAGDQGVRCSTETPSSPRAGLQRDLEAECPQQVIVLPFNQSAAPTG
ncbi:Calcium-binding protein 5 [Liparis tanakae]|uniref:Calcium-binding protein 5 n=1 Tax=Liparis tanakae TaxID=230148 RepID=A0A4Z2EHR0_9TELE|nr:Calcium-binding protein 5 [Liparis tanakae]